MVFVVSEEGKPLMPCQPPIARLLLDQGKAKCVKRTPFTVKLLYKTTNYVQDCVLGTDPGSSKIGSAVVSNNKVIYAAEIEIRNDIKKKMDRRRKYRRNRRSRKTRYRPARWKNRRNSKRKDRLSPTMVSKLNSHLKEINFVKSILPVSKIIIESASFDPHALKNPEVLKNKDLYQKGINYGFENRKAYVLDRDNYTCQHCKGKSKDKVLHVHHIIFRSQGGTDHEDNLITLCKTCHDKLHAGEIKLKKRGKKKQLKHASQMNAIKTQLLKEVFEAEITYGYITKACRQKLGLPKEHYIDAVVIACEGREIDFNIDKVFYKKHVAQGDYQQTKGVRSQQRIPTGKLFGFRKFDKVKYKGSEYFIKGKSNSGYFILMGIDGKDLKLRPIPKVSKFKRISARNSQIVLEKRKDAIHPPREHRGLLA